MLNSEAMNNLKKYQSENATSNATFKAGVPEDMTVFKNQSNAKFTREELLDYLDENKTHQFYWEKPIRSKIKPAHPMENDISLPEKIRGKHFDSWTQLAKELGYGE